MEKLYTDVLYCIMYPIGKCADSFTSDQRVMYDYVKMAFGKTESDHSRLMSMAAGRPAPRVLLKVKVVKARELRAKDVSGTSDPFCVMGIRTEEHSTSTKRTARELLPVTKHSKTCVQKNSLCPVWEESFQFEIKNPSSDCFLLDIWDSDERFTFVEAMSNMRNVSGCGGLYRGLKEIKKSIQDTNNIDDFLGCISYPIRSIVSVGERAWYALEGRSKRSDVQGMIRMNFKLTVIDKKDEMAVTEDCECQMTRNKDIMCVFIDYTLNNKHQCENDHWTGALPTAAVTVVHQHAIHNSLNEFQENICVWSAYVVKHRQFAISYSAMLFYLEHLENTWLQTEKKLLSGEMLHLVDAFSRFIDNCMKITGNHRLYSDDRDNVINMLKCVAKLCKMDLLANCYPDIDLNLEIEETLEKGTQQWYTEMWQSLAPKTNNPSNLLESLFDMVVKINKDMALAESFYKHKFKMIGIDYVSLTYPIIEKNLAMEIKTSLTNIGSNREASINELERFRRNWESDEEFWLKHFKLYYVLTEFASFLNCLPLEVRHVENICDYHEWFRFPLERWLIITREKSLVMIKRVIEVDKVSQLTDHATYSSSAVDIRVCLNEMSEFVFQLAWPNVLESYAIGTHVLNIITEGVQRYAENIHRKLHEVKFFDDIEQFDVSEELCLAINNIEHVRQSVMSLFEKLDSNRPTNEVLSDYDMEKLFCLIDIRNQLVMNADSKMISKIDHVLTEVAAQMQPDLSKKFKTVRNSPLDQSSREAAFTELHEYLEVNLYKLHINLVVKNFERILLALWNSFLHIFHRNTLKYTINNPTFYDWMDEVLDRIKEFFHAEGHGLHKDDLESDFYRNLKQMLLLQSETSQEETSGMKLLLETLCGTCLLCK